MAQSIYGGRIDNEFDQRLLITFLERIFTKGSFDSEFKLASKVDGHKDIKMPDGIRSVSGRSERSNRRVKHFKHVSSHKPVWLQAGGVHALGGDAPRHSDTVVARVAQQCREGVAHHAGYDTADESDYSNRNYFLLFTSAEGQS